MTFFSLFFALLLFFFGLKLSAFFSGSETGFYRVSTLQLTLQKQHGDRVASQLFQFVTHPERFVTTTLVGNNVANYLTTLAIGLLVAAMTANSEGYVEVFATLMLTPIIFVFGELIPKSLYYRAPMSLLRGGTVGFKVCYYLFLPISYPLILASRLVSKFGSSDKRPIEVVFGRSRLYGVLEAGQKEGILTPVQRNLAENLMQQAEDPVAIAMVPAVAVAGASEAATTEQINAIAERDESAYVLLHSPTDRFHWTSFVRIADIQATGLSPRLAKKEMPEFDVSTPRIEVLTQLMKLRVPFGRVVDHGRTVGIIRRQTLVSQLFRVVRSASQLDGLLMPEAR